MSLKKNNLSAKFSQNKKYKWSCFYMAQLFKDYVQIFYRLPCKSSSLLKNYPESERMGLWKSTAKRNKIFISIWDVWSINLLENYLASRSSQLLNIFGGYPGVLPQTDTWSFRRNTEIHHCTLHQLAWDIYIYLWRSPRN